MKSALLELSVGERVNVRDRIWRVGKVHRPDDGTRVLQLDALDASTPSILSVVEPYEPIERLPTDQLTFDTNALSPIMPWILDHRILGATAVQLVDSLSGARLGRVELEQYQLYPAYKLLSKPRPSLLIADDVGLGKTIEAGLCMLEMKARGRARRTLIVVPPGLLLQWQEELQEKFGLEFILIESAAGLARAQEKLPAGLHPWDAFSHVLTSIDYLKKMDVQRRALRTLWDLIIVDEAHVLAEAGSDKSPYRTQRTRLGEALRKGSRGLILLTATPHNGYKHSFRSLIELVDPTLASLSGNEENIRRRLEHARIRRLKSQIKRKGKDGKMVSVFQIRNVEGIPIKVSGKESDLFKKVSSYCARTSQAARDQEDADLVSFAMQIVKKRMLSSRAALAKTIDHRLEALKDDGAPEPPPERVELREMQAALPMDEWKAERTIRKIVRAAIPKEIRIRRSEIQKLNQIKKMLRALPETDPKIETLLAHVHDVLKREPQEKFIVFTEYLDTLNAMVSAFEKSKDLLGKYVIMRGGLTGRQRRNIQEKFETGEIRALLSTDASSEGLNLQRTCRRVIHMELPWNPNRMEQRNGRVDRYGQKRKPEIRYLFYPDSPEDDVLNRIISKMETMEKDRISTPDLLGLREGAEDIDRSLTEMDAESKELDKIKEATVRIFDEHVREFESTMRPFIAASADPSQLESERFQFSGDPIWTDDTSLEHILRTILGDVAMKPLGRDGEFRIVTPPAFQGPGVNEIYPRITCRRSLAIASKSGDVDFITPVHPLVNAIAAAARQRLLHVFGNSAQAGAWTPRRLTARRDPKTDGPYVVFTFFVAFAGGHGLIEERLTSVRVPVRGTAEIYDTSKLFEDISKPGEVTPDELKRIFADKFDRLSVFAEKAMSAWAAGRVQKIRKERHEQVERLRQDLDIDVKDRLVELEESERRAKGFEDEARGQFRLFGTEGQTKINWGARRAAVDSDRKERLEELTAFEAVHDNPMIRPLGAMFVLPPAMDGPVPNVTRMSNVRPKSTS